MASAQRLARDTYLPPMSCEALSSSPPENSSRRSAAHADQPGAAGATARPVVLALSGHDPSGAAGVQADIETLARAGCQCVSVLTALTVQNTARFEAVHPVSSTLFRKQLTLLSSDITVSACKLGMLPDVALVEATAAYLGEARRPVVFDPVLSSGLGDAFASAALVRSMAECLLPHTTVVTPNLAEARLLTGLDDPERALRRLLELGCESVLLTTADTTSGAEVINTWVGAQGAPVRYRWRKLPGMYHGSGCTLSAAIAARLALGSPVQTAVEWAQEYTWLSLKHARQLGHRQLHPERFHDRAG